MKVLIRLVKVPPPEIDNDYWPGTHDTIQNAVKWFKKKFGVAPKIAHVASLSRKKRQLVRMWVNSKLRP